MPTNAARSFRLAGVTSSQLDDLAAFWGESATAALGRAIDRVWTATIYAGPVMPPTQAPAKPMTIHLIENNAGHLFIGGERGPWWRTVGTRGEFSYDATAIANGDTADWTVECYDQRPQGDLVGEWVNGWVLPVTSDIGGQPVAGIAGRQYMGIE